MGLFKTSPAQQAAKDLKAAQKKERKDLKAAQKTACDKLKVPKPPSKAVIAIKNGTAAATSFIARDLHFALKSSADGVAKGEAAIVHKLTGKAKYAIIEDRHNKTEEMQSMVKLTTFVMKKRLGNAFKSNKSSARTADTPAEVAFESEVNSIV